jgi:hypothetical protein
MHKTLLVLFIITLVGWGQLVEVNNPQAIQAPELKWQFGGCAATWCQTGWYSSPAVADLDGDGRLEVIGAAYSIYVLNGITGQLKWKVASGHDRNEPEADDVGRTWPGVVVADIDNDGLLEIVTAHGGGYVSVYTAQGYFEPGWPQRPITSELRGLSVSDLDANGDLEIVVTGAIGSKTNTWVFEHNGTLRPGWPQLSNDDSYAWGVYNDNAAVGDLDGDGMGEVVVPSDVHYICAYEADGTHIPANPIYAGKNWGQVGVWESLETELRGWGECDGVRKESYRANFADGPAVIADMDGDGILEVMAVGNMYECVDGYPSRYIAPFLFNADRSRFKNTFYDWSQNPVDTGAPVSENYDIIESAEPNPVAADLDGDGTKELLFASYDGKLHAFWLNGEEHGNWPVSVYNPYEGFFRFASEPSVADLDNDGKAEVIFTSWAQKGSNQSGLIYIVDYLGNLLAQTPLPQVPDQEGWNGALPAPTLADIDGDGELEAVVNTAHSGFAAYDLPGSENARILWGTGRGSYLRNGYIPPMVIPRDYFYIPQIWK